MRSADVVVVGGGHAGCEAAAAAARCGANVVLVTHALATIGVLSCNPAIGGIGKGHLVREIDALDGLMARAADRAGIHFKVLNRRKGPAVHGPRAQMDRARYRLAMRDLLAGQTGLTLVEAAIDDVVLDATGRACGVLCSDGRSIAAGAVVLTTGTFLRGRLHAGDRSWDGGRVGESGSRALGHALARLGLPVGRLKTGTPPRLYRRGIDWDSLELDWGDPTPEPMSGLTDAITTPQVACRTTATSELTHEMIRASIHLSAVRNGRSGAAGPRYCPSIEDKITRFPDRSAHNIFLEPEGLDSEIVYPNGISTSMPADAQLRFVRSIRGLERAEFVQAGYAVEYDYVDPRALDPSLEVKTLPALFLAGQINGTTGYEEAAAQGILAGMNAARLAGGARPVSLGRAQAFIGVMISDLTTVGVSEPYRMFTSRAEFRITLRVDNAAERLTETGASWGIIGGDRLSRQRARNAALARARAIAGALIRSPTQWAVRGYQVRMDGRARSLLEVLGAGTGGDSVAALVAAELDVALSVARTVAETAMYAAAERRQAMDIRAVEKEHDTPIPVALFDNLPVGFSAETKRLLLKWRPASLGAAGRMEGMTAASVAALARAVAIR